MSLNQEAFFSIDKSFVDWMGLVKYITIIVHYRALGTKMSTTQLYNY